jgi:hydrogenase maturation protease
MNITNASRQKRCPVLVVGIGNILLRDEGFGPYVIKELQKMELPSFVELLDGGTAGADLLDSICDRRKVIVIDTIAADVEPGSILRMTTADLTKNLHQRISLHEFGLVEALLMAKQLNCEPKEVVIFGVKPEDISFGTKLTERISKVVPKVIKLIIDELHQ